MGVIRGPRKGSALFARAGRRIPRPRYTPCVKGSQPDKPGWQARVVPSIAPFLRIEGELDRRGHGLYDIMNGIGAHEVVIETPLHIDNMADLSEQQIANVFNVYINRTLDLEKDPRFKYVLAFKNHGWSAGGGRAKHSRSQLIATPTTPQRVKEELTGSRQYYEYHERCIFAISSARRLSRRKGWCWI